MMLGVLRCRQQPRKERVQKDRQEEKNETENGAQKMALRGRNRNYCFSKRLLNGPDKGNIKDTL